MLPLLLMPIAWASAGWLLSISACIDVDESDIRSSRAVSATASAPRGAQTPVSFVREVVPVLTRSGCNSGACHGNLNGKGGFKLSLKGEDLVADYAALTREQGGRRLNVQAAEESLLLLKATGAVPHEGGIRFTPQSQEYALLRRWIAQGARWDNPPLPALQRLAVSPTGECVIHAPRDRFLLQVTAEFADGTRQNVTHLVTGEFTTLGVARLTPQGEVVREGYGSTVLLIRYLNQVQPLRLVFVPARPTFAAEDWTPFNEIDRLVFQRLQHLRLPPASLCSDEVFLRRAYLDTIGLLPSVDETRTFLADRDPHKRSKLIEQLLNRPEFAENWASKWADILRVEEKSLDRKGVGVFQRWLAAQLAQDRPLAQIAQEILQATGSTYAHPPANFWRAVREPLARAEAVAQVFLGVRIGCARCHNHPFDRWTMDDYYQFAALFVRLDYRIVENSRRDRFDGHEFVGEQIVYQRRDGEMIHPRSGQPAPPRLLATETALPPEVDRLGAVAQWVADPANPFFAAAQVNRVWKHLLGRGLVDPNDDMSLNNPPSHPDVLAWLVDDFRRQGGRLKPLIRRIMTSRTYQLAATAPLGTNSTPAERELYHAQAIIRPLTAEELLDAWSQVCEVPLVFRGYPAGLRAQQLPAPPLSRRNADGPAERFLKTFGKPDRLLTCECERSNDPHLLQAFQLLSGELTHQMLTAPNNRLARLLNAGRSDAEILTELYLAALCRYPSDSEQQAILPSVSRSPNRRQAWEDVLWAILNSKEFLLRQ
ncbi:MAG: DUF1549 and DUF1553 domain-containing protein [Gemmataceae bacterium]|nr:DUF1549 and DUF1553 domain-containing protein [Gemmataceae bacterium]